MRRSDLILPLRIYDELYDQQRFNPQCPHDCCDNALNFSSDEVPFFQFTRPSSLHTPMMLIMRPVTFDNNGKLFKMVPEGADNFVNGSFWGGFPITHSYAFNDGIDPPFTFIRDLIIQETCGIKQGDLSLIDDVSTTPLDGDLVLSIPGTEPGVKYRLKVVIDHISSSGFDIKVYDCKSCMSPVLIETINAAGTYIIEFTPSNGVSLDLFFDGLASTDEFTISEIQLTKLSTTGALFQGDVVVDHTKISVLQLNNGEDVIAFCESPPADLMVPSGDYYYIIEFGDGLTVEESYYSEVFRVKKPNELRNYYKLYWRNTKDIYHTVRYSPSSGSLCPYYNQIYLETGLFSPEYETKEEQEDKPDGPVTNFRRWQKSLKLDIAKCPPFLTDALSALNLHDSIYLTDPLNTGKDVRDDRYQIERVTSEVSDVFQNCFQATIVTFFLSHKHIQTNCTDPLDYYACGTSTPLITDSTELGSPGSQVYLIEGTAKAYSFILLQYRLNGAGPWLTAGPVVQVDSEGNFAQEIDLSALVSPTDLKVRGNNRTITCTYGNSNEVDLI